MISFSSRPLSYDEALTKHIGQFGPGQWLQVLWASLPQIANAAAFFLWVFVIINPVGNHSWRCTDPSDAACTAVWQQDSPTSQTFCSLRTDQWQWTSQDSVVAKFNLVCDNAWKVQFANSLTFMGAFLGSGLFGYLCDRWGRRKPLFLATALVAASMFAGLAAPSYWVMAVLRAVTGIGAAGQTHTIFLLSTEPVGPDFRGFAAIASLVLFTVGEFVIILLAYTLPVWQHLVLAVACINASALLLYPFVSESARWLLSQGRTEEANAVLQRIVKGNNSSMPAQPMVSSSSQSQLQACAEEAAEEGTRNQDVSTPESKQEAPVGLLQLLREWHLAFRFAVLLLNWFALFLNYYGISMGSGGIPGSIYLTFAIGTVCEVVALLVVGPTVDRLGRHNIVALGQLLGGGACVACAMVSGGAAQAVLAGIGKFGCSAAAATIPIYTAELLPTSCRSTTIGICSQASRLGSLAAPFLLMLGAQLGSVGGYSQVFVPFMVFGCLALLAGLLTLLLPETSGTQMPETIEDLNKLQSAFRANPWRQGCIPLLTFLFRTKAATVHTASQQQTSSVASPVCASPAPAGKSAGHAVAALVAAEVRGCHTVHQAASSNVDQKVTNGTAKSSLRDDNPVLDALRGGIEQGAVGVTVHVRGSDVSGIGESSSAGSSTC